MNKLIDKLLGSGPYPFPLNKIENFTRYYESSCVNIVITKTSVSFTMVPQIHSHDSYEFLIPFTTMPYVGCDGMCIPVPEGAVFPINPLQEHGPQKEMLNIFFAAVHVESEYMRKVAQNILGEAGALFINHPILLSKELKILLEKFAEEAVKSRKGNSLILECLSTQIAIQLFMDFSARDMHAPTANIAKNESYLNNAIISMCDNYFNHTYSLQAAAKEANLSKYHFIRVFQKETGKTPYHFILDMKIEKAKELLKERKHSITEVCFLSGFINHSHFTRTFRKKVGVSPSIYRKAHYLD